MENFKSSEMKKIFSNWIIPIVSALIIAFIINKFVIFQVEIPSGSMIPTLNINDRLFATRVYNNQNLERGDMVIFNFEPKNELFIKRLIGLPSDYVEINSGVVSVNGEILEENYIKELGNFTGSYQVPRDEYFFLGDNRNSSFDSRFWDYPFIKGEDIKGKAVLKVYPFDDFGFVK